MFGQTVAFPTPEEATEYLHSDSAFATKLRRFIGDPAGAHDEEGGQDPEFAECEDPDLVELLWWEHGDKFNIPQTDPRLASSSDQPIPIADAEGACMLM